MPEKYIKMLKAMLSGSLTSLEIFFLTLLFAVPLALCCRPLCAFKKPPFFLALQTASLLIRETPLMLQLLMVYFGPLLFVKWLSSYGIQISIKWDRFVAAIIALSINYSAYFAEIYRGGIESIPRGQYEAAKVLGYTQTQTFFRIILPQVVKRIVPAMGNEVITLVKDTALVSVIGVEELLMVANKRQSAMFSFVPLLIAGVFYFVMNWGVSRLFSGWKKSFLLQLNELDFTWIRYGRIITVAN